MGSHSTHPNFGLHRTLSSLRDCYHPNPCDKCVKAPTSKNLTHVSSWFGLVNQVAYAFCITEAMAPFRTLLKPTKTFLWTEAYENAFHLSKQVIAREIQNGVEVFKPTCLATDWSKDGVGYWLFQKHCSCPSEDLCCCRTGWKVTLMGSRFTHAAESRNAPIEVEALGVALDKARHFVLGCTNLTVATDHSPLQKIFGDRSLDQIGNTRLRRRLSATASRWFTSRRQKLHAKCIVAVLHW